MALKRKKGGANSKGDHNPSKDHWRAQVTLENYLLEKYSKVIINNIDQLMHMYMCPHTYGSPKYMTI